MRALSGQPQPKSCCLPQFGQQPPAQSTYQLQVGISQPSCQTVEQVRAKLDLTPSETIDRALRLYGDVFKLAQKKQAALVWPSNVPNNAIITPLSTPVFERKA